MTPEVFQQQLYVATVQRAEKLDSRARGQIGAPVVLLAGLHIDAGHGPDASTGRPRAAELDAPSGVPGLQIRRLLIEDAATAAVDPETGPELVRQPQVRPLVAEVDPPHAAVGEQELVAEVAALMVEAGQRRHVLP